MLQPGVLGPGPCFPGGPQGLLTGEHWLWDEDSVGTLSPSARGFPRPVSESPRCSLVSDPSFEGQGGNRN